MTVALLHDRSRRKSARANLILAIEGIKLKQTIDAESYLFRARMPSAVLASGVVTFGVPENYLKTPTRLYRVEGFSHGDILRRE